MQQTLEISDYKSKRTYIPKDYEIQDWEGLKVYFDYLMNQDPQSLSELEHFLLQINELDAIVQEDLAWRHIRMTCNTQDDALVEQYQYFIKEIMPHLSVYENQLNRKLVTNPFFDQLNPDQYTTFTRSLKKDLELFREENVVLMAEMQSTSQQYGALTGAMSIEYKGETLTIQKAGKLLEDKNRELRKEIWEKIWKRRLEDQENLEDIFDKLVALRHQIAQNAGYTTYTSFKFNSLKRFDYSEADTLSFHESVEKAVKPIYETLMRERKKLLGVERLRPWDLSVDFLGDTPLTPFEEASQLVDKSIEALARLNPDLGAMIGLMNEMGYLDLDSRVGKAPGGYNYPLMEVGVPFIFMNATGTQNDVITMLHESGHAVHAFLTRDIPLNVLKRTPSEVAELAAMAMELLNLDNYHIFYEDLAELIRAKKGQINRCIIILPWIATVDAFQQWIYDNPKHTREERSQKWSELYKRFHGDIVDWSGYEQFMAGMWLKQGHIFEVPFYYIEYAIAQLGAIAIWRNYKMNPQKGLQGYLDALKLGYTKPIPEIYKTANIRFDFSQAYIKECMEFCLQEYQALG